MKSIYIHHHLGLGDHIMCNAIIRHYAKRYNIIFLFVYSRNLNSISYMFRDLDNIKYLTIDDDSYEGQFKVVDSYRQLNPTIEYLKIGHEYLYGKVSTQLDDGKLTAEQLFYDQVGLSWHERYDGFYIKRDEEAEQKVYDYYNPNNEPYVFIHQDSHRKKNINPKYIVNKNIKVIDFNGKISDPKLFNFFHHMKLLEMAEEGHFIDSAFKCLADSFLKNKKNMFFHRYTNFDSFEDSVQKGWTVCKPFWKIL